MISQPSLFLSPLQGKLLPGEYSRPHPYFVLFFCQHTLTILKYIIFILFYVLEDFAWTFVCLCTICVQSLWMPEEGTKSFESRVTESCELPCGCLQSSTGPIEKGSWLLSHLSSSPASFLMSRYSMLAGLNLSSPPTTLTTLCFPSVKLLYIKCEFYSLTVCPILVGLHSRKCTMCLSEAFRGQERYLGLVLQRLWVTKCMLGTEPRSSEGAVSTFNALQPWTFPKA